MSLERHILMVLDQLRKAQSYHVYVQVYSLACWISLVSFLGFSVVPACEFYAFLKYTSHKELSLDLRNFKVDYDLTKFKSYKYAKPLNPEPNVQYGTNLGIKGPPYSDPTDSLMSSRFCSNLAEIMSCFTL